MFNYRTERCILTPKSFGGRFQIFEWHHNHNNFKPAQVLLVRRKHNEAKLNSMHYSVWWSNSLSWRSYLSDHRTFFRWTKCFASLVSSWATWPRAWNPWIWFSSRRRRMIGCFLMKYFMGTYFLLAPCMRIQTSRLGWSSKHRQWTRNGESQKQVRVNSFKTKNWSTVSKCAFLCV